jgi:hypothetical protein
LTHFEKDVIAETTQERVSDIFEKVSIEIQKVEMSNGDRFMQIKYYLVS